MPIRLEHRFFYPIDWPQLSHEIRFVRAKGQCEQCGRNTAGLSYTLATADGGTRTPAAGAATAGGSS